MRKRERITPVPSLATKDPKRTRTLPQDLLQEASHRLSIIALLGAVL